MTWYDVKRFQNSKSDGFAEALNIYCKETDARIYTSDNQINYWLENYKKFYPDELIILGLLINEHIVGFAQFVYMAEEKIIFFDYMAISEECRPNGAFSALIGEINNYIDKNNMHFNYIVVEYPNFSHVGDEPSKKSREMQRLLKWHNFNVINAAYYQPAHGLKNQESFMKSRLMIYSKDRLAEIKKETYLSIVSTLLYKHYYRWYENFEKDIALYKKHLDNIFEKITADVSKSKIIKVNGYKVDDLTPSPPPPPPKKKTPYLMFIMIISGFTVIMAAVNTYFKMGLSGTAFFWLLSLISFLVFVAISDNPKSATTLFKSLLKSINQFFDKLK